MKSLNRISASGQGLININTSVGQLIGGTLIGAVLASFGGELMLMSLPIFY